MGRGRSAATGSPAHPSCKRADNDGIVYSDEKLLVPSWEQPIPISLDVHSNLTHWLTIHEHLKRLDIIIAEAGYVVVHKSNAQPFAQLDEYLLRRCRIHRLLLHTEHSGSVRLDAENQGT
jgi:hypothetical protein